MITLTDGVEVSPAESDRMVERYLEAPPLSEQGSTVREGGAERNQSGGGAQNASDGKGASQEEASKAGRGIGGGLPGRAQKVENLTVAAQSGRTVLLRFNPEP